jgi:hypothetical protein
MKIRIAILLHPSIKYVSVGNRTPAACVAVGHTIKELSRQLTHVAILIRYGTRPFQRFGIDLISYGSKRGSDPQGTVGYRTVPASVNKEKWVPDKKNRNCYVDAYDSCKQESSAVLYSLYTDENQANKSVSKHLNFQSQRQSRS